MTTTDKMEFLDALRAIFNAQEKHHGTSAHARLAWILAEAVADDLISLECAKELVQRIGDEITRSNDYYYNCGYTNGCKNAEEVFND